MHHRCGTDPNGFALHPLREPSPQQLQTLTRLLLSPTKPDKPSLFAVRPPELLAFTMQLYTVLTVRDSKKASKMRAPVDFLDWRANGFRDLLKARVRLHPDIVLPRFYQLLEDIFTAAGMDCGLRDAN